MTFFKTISLTSGIAAGLCVLTLPMWALGVPGVENQYAKGWKMGLNVLLVYPAAWVVNFAPYFVMHNHLSETGRLRWQLVSAWAALAVLVVAAGRMIQAFKAMR